jgi:hypothetical protein
MIMQLAMPSTKYLKKQDIMRCLREGIDAF